MQIIRPFLNKPITLACTLFVFSHAAYADEFSDIMDVLNEINSGTSMVDADLSKIVGQDIKDMDADITKLMTGKYGLGDKNFSKTQQAISWGDSTHDWNSVLSIAQGGGDSSDYGKVVQQLANQFPIQPDGLTGNPSKIQQSFYATQAQTALAQRAASQLDYNKIEQQIQNQQALQQEIENTADLKAATDLQNRLQVEGNLINLEVLRQISLISQNQALQTQDEVNSQVEVMQSLTPTQ